MDEFPTRYIIYPADDKVTLYTYLSNGQLESIQDVSFLPIAAERNAARFWYDGKTGRFTFNKPDVDNNGTE